MDRRLYQASSSGNLSFFMKLENGDTLLHVTTEKNTVLHIAVQCNHPEVAERIVKLCPSLLYQRNSKGNTPLHVAAKVAAKGGRMSMVTLLINLNKELVINTGHQHILSMVNLVKDTALHVAVRYNNLEAVEKLIEEDTRLAMSINDFGESALFLAVDRNLDKIASHILEASPECSCAGRDGMNVLHALVIRARSFEDNWNLTMFATIGLIRRNIFFWVSLYFSIFGELYYREDLTTSRWIRFRTVQEDFVKDVMKKFPSAIMQVDDSGWTPLHIAAHLGYGEVVDLFLNDDNSSAYVKDKDGLSSLHIAAKEGNVTVLRKLIKACPDIHELLDNKGRMALHVAAESGETIAIRFFLTTPDLVGLINEQDQDGNTPMHLAAIAGHPLVIWKLLSRRELDVNAMNKEGLTTMDIILSSTKFRSRVTYCIVRGLRRKRGRLSLREVLLCNSLPSMSQTALEKQKLRQTSKESAAGDGGNATAIAEEGKLARANDLAQTNVLIATLIATITFAAAFTVPGGYESDGVHKGLAVLSKKTAFRVFLIANSLSFGLSTSGIYSHFTTIGRGVSLTNRQRITSRAYTFISLSIRALLIAFISGTYVVLPHSWAVTTAIVLCCSFYSGILSTIS